MQHAYTNRIWRQCVFPGGSFRCRGKRLTAPDLLHAMDPEGRPVDLHLSPHVHRSPNGHRSIASPGEASAPPRGGIAPIAPPRRAIARPGRAFAPLGGASAPGHVALLERHLPLQKGHLPLQEGECPLLEGIGMEQDGAHLAHPSVDTSPQTQTQIHKSANPRRAPARQRRYRVELVNQRRFHQASVHSLKPWDAMSQPFCGLQHVRVQLHRALKWYNTFVASHRQTTTRCLQLHFVFKYDRDTGAS